MLECADIAVSDAQVKKHYDDNKDNIRGLVVAAGGSKAVAVMFDTDEKAKAFLTKVEEKGVKLISTANSRASNSVSPEHGNELCSIYLF